MPLVIYDRREEPDSTFLLWKATESTSHLLERLNPGESLYNEFNKIKLEKRKREWLVSRILLQLVRPDALLTNLPNGKPTLAVDFCSFSHCGDYGGLVISAQPVGLDIQGIDERLMTISPKFCHRSEIEFASNNAFSEELYTILWSTKEAVFKYFGEGVIFAEDIVVRPFLKQQEVIVAEYRGRHGHCIFHLRNTPFLGYHIVYTHHIEEIKISPNLSLQWESNR